MLFKQQRCFSLFYRPLNIKTLQILSIKMEEEDRMEELEEEQQRIKQYLKTLPYEMILEQRAKERSSTQYQQRKFKSLTRPRKVQQSSNQQSKPVLDKNAPLQRSAKIRVNRMVKVFDDKKKRVVDPRFEEYTGTYNPHAAKKAFSFVGELQEKEKKVLKKELSSKRLSEGQREILSRRYNQVTNSIQANKNRQIQQAVSKEHRSEIANQMKEGKIPFFKKKGIKKDDFNKKKLQKMSYFQRQRFVAKAKKEVDYKMQNRKYKYQQS